MKDANTTDSAAFSFKTAIPIAFEDHHSPFKSDDFWFLLEPHLGPQNKDAENSNIKPARKECISLASLKNELGEITTKVPPLPRVQPEKLDSQSSYSRALEAARLYLKKTKR